MLLANSHAATVVRCRPSPFLIVCYLVAHVIVALFLTDRKLDSSKLNCLGRRRSFSKFPTHHWACHHRSGSPRHFIHPNSFHPILVFVFALPVFFFRFSSILQAGPSSFGVPYKPRFLLRPRQVPRYRSLKMAEFVRAQIFGTTFEITSRYGFIRSRM